MLSALLVYEERGERGKKTKGGKLRVFFDDGAAPDAAKRTAARRAVVSGCSACRGKEKGGRGERERKAPGWCPIGGSESSSARTKGGEEKRRSSCLSHFWFLWEEQGGPRSLSPGRKGGEKEGK